MDIILASASPRRKGLLSLIYNEFRIIPSDIRELVPRDLPVDRCPEYLACAKAEMVSHGREKCNRFLFFIIRKLPPSLLWAILSN